MDKANFFAILPSTVRYNAKLTSRSILLYATLTSLAQANGEAFASNEYLMNVLDTSERTIARLLAQLINEKYVTVRYEYQSNTREIARRLIRINPLPLLLDLPSSTQAMYAVIPSHILAMPGLSVQAKLLYAEISAATPTDGFCSQPATFFATLLHASVPTVRRWIKELQVADAVRIEMEYKGETKEIRRRRIYITAAADIAEKRAEIAMSGAKSIGTSNPPNEPVVANSPDYGQIQGMLIFDTTSNNTPQPHGRSRKICRKRKKATEKLRL